MVHAIILQKKIKHGIHRDQPKGRGRGRSVQNKGDGGEQQQMLEGVRVSDHYIGEVEQGTLPAGTAQHQREVSTGQPTKLPGNCYLE